MGNTDNIEAPIQIQGKHIEIKYDKKYIVLMKYDFFVCMISK